MAASELEKEDGILGSIPRHCILHALTVIEAAIFKESSSVLDDFVKELTSLICPKGRRSGSLSHHSFNSSLIPPLEVNQFYENAITTQEFAIKVEKRINEAIKQSTKKVDIEEIQMICWKYYSSEKKKALSFPKWLSPTCTYRLFVIFNQLLGDEMTVQITEQKMNYLLERIVLSCGFQSQAIMQVVKNDHKSGISFPEFLKEITNAFEFLKLEMSLTCEMILDLLDEIVMGVLKKGYLTKRGGNRKNWKKRWFILKENTLFYYESRENLTQKGGMVLNKATDVISLPDEKGKLYRFVVTCGVKGRAFEIKASDQRTKSEWMHTIKEAISLGRLKRNDIEDDDDPCEMAAHYRLKYGISDDKLTKSLPALQHSHNGSLGDSLSTSITSSVIPTIQEIDSDSDADDTSTAVAKPSARVVHRTKSHELQISNSSATFDIRQPATTKGNKPSPKFRHSSFFPSSGYDKLKFTDNEEAHSNHRYVNAPVQNRSLSSPSLPATNPYHYVRKSIAVVEGITGVYGSTPKNHGYQNIKQPMDVQGDRHYVNTSNQDAQDDHTTGDKHYVNNSNQDVQDDNATDEVYEDVDFPGENTPPLPPRHSHTGVTGANKHVDSHGYLKIYPNHTDDTTTTADAHESVPRPNAVKTLSDHPELSDTAN